jgi:sugar phosphate isomerase/epimerase
MKTLWRLALLPLIPLLAVSTHAADFHDHTGLQLWSVREKAKESLPAALDLVKGYGVKEVEAFAIPGVTVDQLASELKSRGLVAVGTHTAYPDLAKDIDLAIRNAKTLGAKFLVCPYPKLDQSKVLSEEIAHEMAANFNKWGAACKAAGLRFGFHPHGLEFRKLKEGSPDTAFDILARETKPDLVCYELDVFWAFHAGQDPVALMNKYPNRFALMHVKDIRKGAVTGLSTGKAAPIDNVTVGTGQIDWPSVLRTAQKVGIQHYFIEDETPTPLQCIPDSLKYLKGLKL